VSDIEVWEGFFAALMSGAARRPIDDRAEMVETAAEVADMMMIVRNERKDMPLAKRVDEHGW